MVIWIRDEIGYIDGYSLIDQPDLISIDCKSEPTDFWNWHWDGEYLIKDEKNAPQPEPVKPTDIELLIKENKELKEQMSEITDAVLFISEKLGGTE